MSVDLGSVNNPHLLIDHETVSVSLLYTHTIPSEPKKVACQIQ